MMNRWEGAGWLLAAVMVVAVFGGFVAGGLMGWGRDPRAGSGPVVPEAGPPAVTMTTLKRSGWGGLNRGVYRLQVDGRTFLLVVDTDGLALVQYEPAEGADHED